MDCKHCFNEIDVDAVYCRHCGRPVKTEFFSNITKKDEIVLEDIEQVEPQIQESISYDVTTKPLFKFLPFAGPIEFMLLSFVFAFLGQHNLYTLKLVQPGLIYFLIAVIFFTMSDFAVRRSAPTAPIIINKKVEYVLFGLIIFIAAFFRIHLIGETPAGFFYDETLFSEYAVKLLEGIKLPVYSDELKYSTSMIYLIAAAFKVFGIGLLQERLVSVVMGIMSVAAFYFLVRSVFGVNYAVAGGILLAVTRWHVNFSRVGFYAVYGVFLGILAIYFAWKVYKTRSLRDFMLFGISSALVAYGYTPGRMVYPALIIFMVYIAFTDVGFYKNNWKKIVIAASLFFLVFAPFGMHFAKNPGDFMSRTKEVSILNEKFVKKWFHGRFTVKEAVADTFKTTTLMFNHKGDFNPRHNLMGEPMLDFLSGAFAFLGFGYMLFRILTPFHFMCIFLFAFALLPGLLTVEAPQSHRVIYAIPIVLLFILTVFQRFIYALRVQYKGRLQIPGLILLAGVLVAMGVMNYNTYFNKQAKDNISWVSFDTFQRTTAEYIIGKGDDWHSVIDPAFMGKTFNYIMKINNEKDYTKFTPRGSVPFKNNLNKNIVYILSTNYEKFAQNALQQIYPGGKVTLVKHKFDNRYNQYVLFEVLREEVNANVNNTLKNGLTAKYYSGVSWQGREVVSRIDPVVNFDWHITPVRGMFSAKWTGSVIADKPGKYQFVTKSNNYNSLTIDGKKIIDNKKVNGMFTTPGFAVLTKGKHRLEMTYKEDSLRSTMHLMWVKPGETRLEVIPFESLLPE